MNRQGICKQCGEHTDVAEPCCNAGVYYQGSIEHSDYTLPPNDGVDLIESKRMMVCSYGCNTKPSDPKEAFFEYRPDKSMDWYYCGCRGWD